MSDNNEKPQRDARGFFLPGNKCSKGHGGNPWVKEMQEYRHTLFQTITPENLRKITEAQITKAEKGDTKAATLIFSLTGLLIKRIEADITAQEITPEEARRRVAEFFGDN